MDTIEGKLYSVIVSAIVCNRIGDILWISEYPKRYGDEKIHVYHGGDGCSITIRYKGKDVVFSFEALANAVANLIDGEAK